MDGEDIAIAALTDRIRRDDGSVPFPSASSSSSSSSLVDSFEAAAADFGSERKGGQGGGRGVGGRLVHFWKTHPNVRKFALTFFVVSMLVIFMSVYLKPDLLAKERDLEDDEWKLDPLKVLMWSVVAGIVAAGMSVFINK